LDGLGFKILDIWKSAKEEFHHSTHITVDWRQADRTLLTSWCMMLISKKQSLKLRF